MNNDAKLRNQYGETQDPTQPLVVDSVEAQQVQSISETITYNGKAAAGAISINSTGFKSIVSAIGDRVGSYWGLDKNKVYEAVADGDPNKGDHWLLSLVETNGSAAFVVYDPTINLENAFESTTGTVKRFVAKLTDKAGNVLYGWILGVAASSGNYTFDICNNRLTETRNWVGTLDSFDSTALQKVEIFNYSSSLTFGTGTTATEEVACPREYSKSKKAQIDYAIRYLSNGQYIVDYQRGWVIVKKADTTASETITYNVWVSTASGPAGLASDVNVTKLAGQAVQQGVTTPTSTLTGVQNVLPEAVYNATPTVRTEGQGGVFQATVNGDVKIAESYLNQSIDNNNGVTQVLTKPIANAQYSWTRFKNLGANATLNVKATGGNVRSVACFNANAAVRYLQLHDTATTPGAGAVPVNTFPMAASGGFVREGADFFGDAGSNFVNGIAFAVSTTRDTYTAATAADHATYINFY